MDELVVPSLTSIYPTELGVVAVLRDVSFLKTPEAESSGEYQIDSLFNIEFLELTTAVEPVFTAALRTYRSSSGTLRR